MKCVFLNLHLADGNQDWLEYQSCNCGPPTTLSATPQLSHSLSESALTPAWPSQKLRKRNCDSLKNSFTLSGKLLLCYFSLLILFLSLKEYPKLTSDNKILLSSSQPHSRHISPQPICCLSSNSDARVTLGHLWFYGKT